jgi:hypothetical protein
MKLCITVNSATHYIENLYGVYTKGMEKSLYVIVTVKGPLDAAG